MSDLLTYDLIHHHNVDVQMLTVVHIQDVLSQAFMNSYQPVFKRSASAFIQNLSKDGVNVEHHCTSKNNSLVMVS